MENFEKDLESLAGKIQSEHFLNGQNFYKWFVNGLKNLLKIDDIRYEFDYDSIDKSTSSIMKNTFKWFNNKMSGKYHFLSSGSENFERLIGLLRSKESIYDQSIDEIITRLSILI